VKFSHDKYKSVRRGLEFRDLEQEDKYAELADIQYEYARQYQRNRIHQNLDQALFTYVDLKYCDMWSDELAREKKQELKKRSMYYRLVK
jgi:hypothetical protein